MLRVGAVRDYRLLASQFDQLAAGISTPVAAQTLAPFCATFGEVTRQGAGGGIGSAQTILFTALRASEAVRNPQASARAAYRLALTSLAVGGSDSRSASSAELAASAAASVSESADDLCRLDPGRDGRANPLLTLICAQARADAIGDTRTAGLATLRWARLTLSSAESSPLGVGRLRRIPVEIAARLERPGFVESEPEIASRLIETYLDANVALDARTNADTTQPRSEPLLRKVAGQLAETSGEPALLSAANALQARLDLLENNPGMAIGRLRRAIGFESQLDTPTRLPEWHLLLAVADEANRAAHVASAYRALQSIRPVMPARDDLTEESTLSLRMRKTFQEEVSVKLASLTNKSGGSIEDVQKIIEAYREAEIASVLGDDCVPPTPTPIEPADLGKTEFILYPIVLSDRLELLYATGARKAYRQIVVPGVKGADVAALARELQGAASGASEGDAWKGPARALYDLLIKPLEGELFASGQEAPTLVIIPDGPLRGAPLAALLDASGRPLILKARLAIAPSLSFTPGVGGGSKRTGSARVLAASLSQEVILPAGSFAKLEATSAEADQAMTFGGARQAKSNVRLKDFTREDLRRHLVDGKFEILHLATHAAFNGRSEQSFIVASGGAVSLADLRAWISQNRTKGADLDLLVLSACETAVGDDSANMGLAGAAIQAGAVSAIASLWQVNDASSAELMRAFYDAYGGAARSNAPVSKAEALRAAQEKMFLAGGRNAHPHHWAAYTLIGGWR